MNPKVSILLLYWDVPHDWAWECLNSLNSQTYKNFETICVDNASLQVGAGLQSHYDFYVRKREWGPWVDSLKLFLRIARGEYVMVLPMNDWLEPNYLERCVPLLDADPEAMFVAPNGSVWSDDIYNDNAMWSHSLYRREAWERWPHERNPINVEGAEDWRHWMLMRKAGVKGICIPDQLVQWRQHDGMSARLNGTSNLAKLKEAFRKEVGFND